MRAGKADDLFDLLGRGRTHLSEHGRTHGKRNQDTLMGLKVAVDRALGAHVPRGVAAAFHRPFSRVPSGRSVAILSSRSPSSKASSVDRRRVPMSSLASSSSTLFNASLMSCSS